MDERLQAILDDLDDASREKLEEVLKETELLEPVTHKKEMHGVLIENALLRKKINEMACHLLKQSVAKMNFRKF